VETSATAPLDAPEVDVLWTGATDVTVAAGLKDVVGPKLVSAGGPADTGIGVTVAELPADVERIKEGRTSARY